MPVCTAVFDTFQPLSCDVLASIINKLSRTTCGLDPFPTILLMSHLSSIIYYYCLLYNALDRDFTMAKYLNTITIQSNRKAMAQLRLSSHKLMIE